MKQNIEQKIEASMHSLEGISRAKAPGYLYAKVLSGVYRIGEQTIWERLTGFIARPVVALGCIILVVAINALIIFSGNDTSIKNTTASAEPVDLYAYDIYNAENIEP